MGVPPVVRVDGSKPFLLRCFGWSPVWACPEGDGRNGGRRGQCPSAEKIFKKADFEILGTKYIDTKRIT